MRMRSLGCDGATSTKNAFSLKRMHFRYQECIFTPPATAGCTPDGQHRALALCADLCAERRLCKPDRTGNRDFVCVCVCLCVCVCACVCARVRARVCVRMRCGLTRCVYYVRVKSVRASLCAVCGHKRDYGVLMSCVRVHACVRAHARVLMCVRSGC